MVLTVAREKIRPPLIPHVETVTDPGTGKQVAVVTVEAGYALHAMWRNNHCSYFIRVGRQSRKPDPDELPRLLQQRSGFRAELRPISGPSFEDLMALSGELVESGIVDSAVAFAAQHRRASPN